MNYIDSDVLIHSLVNQNPTLHLIVNDLLNEMLYQHTFRISWLNVQEIGFVLARLEQPREFISAKLKLLMLSLPCQYGSRECMRALELAEIIGYKNFNDCLHTAIAEQHCTNLYTCNSKDFKRIQPHTSLNIHFL